MKRGDYHLILIGAKGLIGIKSAHHKTTEVKLWRQIFNDVKVTKPVSGMQFGLTLQETKIANLISTGLRDKEVAEKLSIEKSTVATHIKHIYEKTGARNRAQMVLKLGSMTLT